MTRGRKTSRNSKIIKQATEYKERMEEAGVFIHPTPRSDVISIQKRRAQVWEMFCQGVPEAVMAELLKCSVDVIRRDVAYWKETVGGSLQEMRHDINAVAKDLGTTIKKLDWITENCFIEYSTDDKSATNRMNALNTAIKALSLRSQVLTNTGFYPKAGIEVNVHTDKKQTFADRFGEDSPLKVLDDPSIRRKCLSIAEKLIKNGVNKVIEIEHKPKE